MYVQHAAFHPYWNQKSCTFEDIAAEIPEFHPSMLGKINTQDIMSSYSNVVHPVEEEEDETGIVCVSIHS